MGILDFLTGNSAAASPWGMLYQQPAPQTFMDYSMGYPVQTPASPWGDPSQSSVANPTAPPAPAPATGFGAGASPFGFAGPGSMNGVNPGAFAAPIGPQPGMAPAPAPIAAAPAPASDLSSVNRPPAAPVQAAPAADDSQEAAPVRPPVAPVITGQPSPFSLAGAGLGDRLGASVQSFANTDKGGLVGKLANGISSLVTGQRADPTGVALQLQGQADTATARALLAKNVDPATVQAAVAASRAGQPDMLKTLIAQNFGPDKFQHVTIKDENGAETPGSFDPTTGKYDFGGKKVGADANELGGTVTGPDGKPITIPAGVNRKEFIKQVTHAAADAATGKKTEAQAKASSFAARMTQAEGVLGGLQNEGLSLGNTVAGKIPVAGNYLQSTDYQRYKQASSAFITAMLRQESGAAINKSEFDRYEKEMFPQPGDDPTVVQQKAAMRAAAIEQMKGAAGPGFKGPAPGGTVNVGGAAINWSVK